MLFSLAERRQVKQQEVVEAFISLHATRTQLFYRNAIRLFYEITGKDILDADLDSALRWADLYSKRAGYSSRAEPGIAQKVSKATLKTQCTCLYQIWQQLKQHGYSATNPFDSVHNLLKRGAHGGDKRPTKALSPEQIRALFASIPGTNKAQIMHLAFLALLLGGGLRIQEALGLTLNHVEIRGDTAILTLAHTKAQKAQTQVLPAWASAHIARYLEQRVRDGAKASDPFLTHYRRRWTIADNSRVNYTTARAWWDGLLADAGIAGAFSPHSARASAATQLNRLGLPLTEIRAFMRHRDVATTIIYIKRDESPEAAPGKQLKY